MSLRPRYSLLTLLVLTALVAGGMKLWHGPHHVVERPEPDQEYEYTFTRDWRGNRILQGACVTRCYKAGNIDSGEIHYFRQGVELPWLYYYAFFPNDKDADEEYRLCQYYLGTASATRSKQESPLQQNEQVEFQEAMQREKLKLPAGQRCLDYEGTYNFPSKFKQNNIALPR
jgi:hypothetical protein